MGVLLRLKKLHSLLLKRPKQLVDGFDNFRSRFLIAIFLSVFLVIAIRAVTIQVFSPSSDILDTLARRQYQAKIDLSPYRGNIFDRRGEPLAISIRRPSLYVNPRVFDPSASEVRELSKILNLPTDKIRGIAHKKNYFAWLVRKIDVAKARKVQELNLKGLFEISEPARFYPTGADLSHLIGYVGIENKGLMGLELAYNETLQGDRLTTYHNRDARGNSIYRDSILALPEKTGKT